MKSFALSRSALSEADLKWCFTFAVRVAFPQHHFRASREARSLAAQQPNTRGLFSKSLFKDLFPVFFGVETLKSDSPLRVVFFFSLRAPQGRSLGSRGPISQTEWRTGESLSTAISLLFNLGGRAERERRCTFH